MKKFFLENLEKERIKLLYESYGIILNEDNIIGSLARKALSWVGKNEDEIAKLFKTTELALAKNLDDIVLAATKSKSITPIEDIQKKLMHIFNPSDAAENIVTAQQKTRNFLNGYAQSKGKSTWKEIQDEVKGVTPASQARSSSTATASSAASNINNMFKSGSIVSGNSLRNLQPDWSQIKYAKNWDEYNKVIGDAIRTGNFSGISRKGFEKYGLTGEGGFREWIQNLARNMDLGAMSSSGTKDWFFKLR